MATRWCERCLLDAERWPLGAQMEKHIKAFQAVFAKELPELYWHFQDLGITPNMYMMDWYVVFAHGAVEFGY